jgi:hypothetical protein
MTRVPAAYLKQLAEEREIFNELPSAVKQQVRAGSSVQAAAWGLIYCLDVMSCGQLQCQNLGVACAYAS